MNTEYWFGISVDKAGKARNAILTLIREGAVFPPVGTVVRLCMDAKDDEKDKNGNDASWDCTSKVESCEIDPVDNKVVVKLEDLPFEVFQFDAMNWKVCERFGWEVDLYGHKGI